MTLIPFDGYAMAVSFKHDSTVRKKIMFYYDIAQEKMKDAQREADQYRLNNMANQSNQISNRKRLAKLAGRFGLTHNRKRVQEIKLVG